MNPRSTPHVACRPSPPWRRLLAAGVIGVLGYVAYQHSAAQIPRPAARAPSRTAPSVTRRPRAAATADGAAAARPADVAASVPARADAITDFAALDGADHAPAAYLFDRYTALLEPFLAAGNYRAALEVVLTTPRADVRRLLIAALCDVWGRVSPADAAAWLAAQPEFGDRTRLTCDVFTSWSARDPGPALTFALALPPGNCRLAALAATVQQWATREPATARAWAAANAIAPTNEITPGAAGGSEEPER